MAVRREDRGGAPVLLLLRIGCNAWDIRLDHRPQEAKGSFVPLTVTYRSCTGGKR